MASMWTGYRRTGPELPDSLVRHAVVSMSTDTAWAYTTDDGQSFRASELTRGPWHPDHQHAGPPSALVCRAIRLVAARHGFGHLGRLTGNLMRPVTIGECRAEVSPDYVGRNAGHYSARLFADGKEGARFTALMQREDDLPVPTGTAGHPLPGAPKSPHDSPACRMTAT